MKVGNKANIQSDCFADGQSAPAAAGGRIVWHRRLAFRLIFLLSLCSVLIFTVTLGYNYYRIRGLFQEKMRNQAMNMAAAVSGRVETAIFSVMAVTDTMAGNLESFTFSDRQLRDAIMTSVITNPDIMGSTVAFAPGENIFSHENYAPYFHRSGRSTGFVNLYDEYDCSRQDWFQIPRELRRSVWSEPYYDKGGGNMLMATYSVPFYRWENHKRQFVGVVTADIALSRLTDIVASIKVLKTGYGFLLSRNGTFLAHPLQKIIMNESIFSLAEAKKSKELRMLGRKMIHGESGFIPYTSSVTGVRGWLYYTPLPAVGWSLGLIFPKNELLADIRILTATMAGIGLAGILILTVVVAVIAKSITTPLHNLAVATEKIAKGNFAVDLPRRKNQDEVGLLTYDFKMMQDSLQDHIKRLGESMAARERIESELKIAHDIQMSILPKIFPPFPDRDEFDLYALITPAREVGGDFYDFFQINEQILCFIIGDVSGKGVPASLFMAVTKTMIKSTAKEGVMPDVILSQVNDDLASGNDACMFVSLFCGFLDTASGEVFYANAGHNPPLLVKRNGDVEWLPRAKSLVAGVMPGLSYTCESLTLAPFDSLFLYTDGVVEAMNTKEEFFSEERLKKELAQTMGEGLPIQETIHNIEASVQNFADGAVQSDDITMLMLRYGK